MKQITYLLLAFSLLVTGCSSIHISHNNQDEITVDEKASLTFNEHYIVLTYPSKSLFYDKQAKIYNENKELIKIVNLKEDEQLSLYNSGYLILNLNNHNLTIYDFNDSKTTINLPIDNPLKFAYITNDGSKILYQADCLYLYDIQNHQSTKLDETYTSLELLKCKDNDFILKDKNTSTIIKVNNKSETFEVLYTNQYAYYLDENFAITQDDNEIMTIYNQNLNQTSTIQANIQEETILASNTTSLITTLNNQLFYYDFETMYKYTLDLEIEDNYMIYLSDENEISFLDNNLEYQRIKIDPQIFTQTTSLIEIYETISLTTKTIIDVPVISQMPNYPTGCESVSTVMYLNYLGEDITVEAFINNYLDKATLSNGKAPSPYEAFIGNPKDVDGYGCMAPVIEEAVNEYFGCENYIQNTTGLSLKSLCKNFIDRGHPVLVWASIDMLEMYPSTTWLTPDGTYYTWPANEHCLLLVGYDSNYYYFNDPWNGKVMAYRQKICENRYEELGSQSLVIYKRQ